MTTTTIALAAAALLVSLVAGFVFAFAVVVMPGIRALDDGEFIRAFQEMDGIIQRGDPRFGAVFLGSILALLVAVGFDVTTLGGFERALLLASGSLYVAGVLIPTGAINVPLNNRLQQQRLEALAPEERRSVRQAFEPRWNRWNRIRTVLACLTAISLTALLARL